MPVILSNDRKLEGRDNALALQGFPGETLFSLPFHSPTRSGIEYPAVGLEVDLLNQWRDHTKPTWKFGIEGRFSVDEPVRACNESPSGDQVQCAYSSDIDRDGQSDSVDEGQVPLEGNFSASGSAGVSRGTTGLVFHTYMSKRIKYLEPYAGIEGLVEFQLDDSDFGATDVQGALVNHPPPNGTLVMGLAVMRWEVRERMQRVELDVRFSGTYRSQGRDYSELFDALGSSDATSLREPKFASYDATGDPENPSIVDVDSAKVYMTGITEVKQPGVYKFQTAATWMTGPYLKVNAGLAFTLVQGHHHVRAAVQSRFHERFGRWPCRHSNDPDASDNASGFAASGIPNANYRESSIPLVVAFVSTRRRSLIFGSTLR